MIEHHERQPPIALQRVFEIKVDNRLFLPVLQPEIPRDQGIVLVDFAVAALPVVILARSDAEPVDKVRHCDAGALGPAIDKVNYRIARIMGNPGRG